MKRKKSRHFTEMFKRQVIDYYLLHRCPKIEVWKKYIGEEEEHGRILRWMRQLGYVDTEVRRVSYLNVMSQKTDHESSELKGNLHENELVKQLRKQLEEEKLKAIAYSKMIDIAEEEFNISIRKKCNTKP
ncbi:MAG: transposase [Saprospiraceae bacterium]|jgi:transposase